MIPFASLVKEAEYRHNQQVKTNSGTVYYRRAVNWLIKTALHLGYTLQEIDYHMGWPDGSAWARYANVYRDSLQ